MPLRPVRELSTGWFVAACFGLAFLATVGVAFAASPLPRITPDSASYLTGVEKMVNDGTFESCTTQITLFAPGYSAAMAPLVAIGLDAPDASRLVNALAALVLVLAVGALARAAGLSRLVCVVVAAGVGLSFATLRNGAHVWSEPLFCAMLAALLVVVVNNGHGLALRVSARLVLVLGLTWALLLTRHSGVFVLPAVLAAGWLGSKGIRGRLKHLAAYTLGLVAVPALWWTRNVDVDGTSFGRRSGSGYSAWEVIRQFPDGLSSLALPSTLPEPVRLLVLAPLILAAVLAWPRSRGAPSTRLTVCVVGVAAVVYGAAMTFSATRTLLDPVDTRYLSPLLVPTAVLVAVGVAGPTTVWPRVERILAGFAMALVAVMAVLAPGIAWRGHTADRNLSNIPEDVSCADWPARYSGAAVGLTRDLG